MAKMTPDKKLIKARSGLILDNPFFGTLALKLILKEDPSCKTAWTDGVNLGYNPDFVGDLEINQLQGLLAHEVMHCALSHQLRRNNREPKKWNKAADYVINANLLESGFALPDGGLVDPQYKDKSTDHTYSVLPIEEEDENDGAGTGACADGWDFGEVRDAPIDHNDQSAVKEAETDWKIATAQAAEAAKIMGKIPAGMDRLIGSILESKVNWKEVLRRFITQNDKSDYSWTKPNRKFVGLDIYLPSLYSQAMGEIIIAVDTSGSISQKDLAQFSAEINDIAADVRPSILNVIYCDTKINGEPDKYTPNDLPLQLKAKGGGGTDFRPPFEWVDKEGIRPECFVYLTDMECSSFPTPPDYPVLWINTSGERGKKPPFGDIIPLN